MLPAGIDPYYADEEAAIYVINGDCREVLPRLVLPTDYTLVTDPTWPNAKADIFGKGDPEGMMHQMFGALPHLPLRLAVQLGCDSDPRFLRAVPVALPFFRTCTLEIARCGYKGRLLMTGDTGYLFGAPPPVRDTGRVIPGRCMDSDPGGRSPHHPCPRKLFHVQWLVRWWSARQDTVLDPFMGIGTTLVAAKKQGRKAIGIEIEERYCRIARDRIMATPEPLPFPKDEPQPEPITLF